jgi:hypothetical protein
VQVQGHTISPVLQAWAAGNIKQAIMLVSCLRPVERMCWMSTGWPVEALLTAASTIPPSMRMRQLLEFASACSSQTNLICCMRNQVAAQILKNAHANQLRT